MAVPNKVTLPLDKVWSADDYRHLIMAVGFATGMLDDNASEEMKELYKQTAIMCEKFVGSVKK